MDKRSKKKLKSAENQCAIENKQNENEKRMKSHAHVSGQAFPLTDWSTPLPVLNLDFLHFSFQS